MNFNKFLLESKNSEENSDSYELIKKGMENSGFWDDFMNLCHFNDGKGFAELFGIKKHHIMDAVDNINNIMQEIKRNGDDIPPKKYKRKHYKRTLSSEKESKPMR